MKPSKSLKLKLYIKDRSYKEWTFVDNETNKDVPMDFCTCLQYIDPNVQKLFSRDVIEIVTDNWFPRTDFVHSHVRTSEYIAGVLVLEGNKTFGRTENKKRLLYKCIPDDHRIPIFLVPYELKVGFSKVYKNKFVIFKFDHWKEKHPYGTLLETIGDVDNLEAFYEFQLYCKNLHVPITDFTNRTRASLNKKTNEEFVEQILHNPLFQIEDRRSNYVFTIDPAQSLDYDDGFGIEKVGDNWRVSIYIANVFVWLETLGLWNSLSKRVSTIYLPDRRRPMLPTILSDILCSLQQNQPRFAMVMDIMIDENGKLLENQSIKYKNVLINVRKNYAYEDPKMLTNDATYKQLFEISYLMDKSIRNSHDIVAHWMVQMNTFTGILMAQKKVGVFRSAAYLNTDFDTSLKKEDMSKLNEDTVRVIKSWNNTIGQYVPFTDDIDFHHMLIRNNVAKNNSSVFNNQDGSSSYMNMYIHITSPIRRLVDLLNQIILLENFSLITTLSPDVRTFMQKWMTEMEYINTSMRYIRKIQTSCELLSHCFKNPDMMENQYKGVVFDKIIKNDGFITYMVYLEEIKLLSRITTQVDVANYSYNYFNMYLFEDEDKIKKKIRLQIVHPQ
jgi:exoribonuclease R